jgi:hypothetical protein
VPATTPALFPDIFPRSQFNSSPLRVSRHPHTQSWITFPLSHPPPQLHPLVSSLLSSPDHKITPCYLISALTDPPHCDTQSHIISDLKICLSQIWISPHIFLSRLTLTSPQLNSPRLPCFPSSPHWVLQHTLQSSHVLTADCYRLSHALQLFCPTVRITTSLHSPALTPPTTSEFVQWHMLCPSPSHIFLLSCSLMALLPVIDNLDSPNFVLNK